MLVDDHKTPDKHTKIKKLVQAALREASAIRKLRPAQPVNLKGQSCSPKEAAHLRIHTDAPPAADTHWMGQCNIFLSQILDSEQSSSPSPSPSQSPSPSPTTPKKRTITDHFRTPTTQAQTSPKEPHPAPLVEPSECLTPVFGDMKQPTTKILKAEQTLVAYVDAHAEADGVTATGMLDRVLHDVHGARASTLKGSRGPSAIPKHVKNATATLLNGLYPSGPSCAVKEVCRPVCVEGSVLPIAAMGDCALYAILAVAMVSFQPPPLNPTAEAAVRVWAIRRMLIDMQPPPTHADEALHLQYLSAETLVRLAHLLGIYCTVVQLFAETYYIVAEPSEPYAGGMHAVVLQHPEHF